MTRRGPTGRRAPVLVAVVALTMAAAVGCSSAGTPEAFCEQVPAVVGLDEALDTGDAAQVSELLVALRDLQEASPPEIQPAVATLVEVTDDLDRTLGTTPGNDADVAATEVFTRRADQLDQIGAAGERLESYALATCGVVLNSTGTAPGTTVPGTTTPTGPTSTNPSPGPSEGP